MMNTILFACFGSAVAIPILLLNIRFAHRFGWIDWPKARGVAEEQIPIVGHSLVFLSLICMAIVAQLESLSPWFLVTASVMAIMGYRDDRKPLPALDKMFWQVVCVVTVVLFDPLLHQSLYSKFGTPGIFWGIFFILGLVNAINFIDGIDGLAGMVILVGSAGFLILSRGQVDLRVYGIFAAILCGMIIPFLYLNIVKRKGFLGNVGSYFFSYTLAVMHLSLSIEGPSPLPRIALSALCFLIPLADATSVLISRALTFRSPLQADKGHLHHRLVQSSIPLRYILLNFLIIEVSALSLAAVIYFTPAVRSSWVPLVLCAVLVSLAAILIMFADKVSKKRLQAYFQRLDAGGTVYFVRYEVRERKGRGNPSIQKMKRLEAKINAEIRVTDMCYFDEPNRVCVVLTTVLEPLRSVVARLESVFHQEGLETTVILDEAQLSKVPPVSLRRLRGVT